MKLKLLQMCHWFPCILFNLAQQNNRNKETLMETKLLLKVSYYLIKQSKAFKNYIFHLRFTQYLRQRAYIRLSNLESALKDHIWLWELLLKKLRVCFIYLQATSGECWCQYQTDFIPNTPSWMFINNQMFPFIWPRQYFTTICHGWS